MNTIEVRQITKIYRKGFRGIKVPAVVDLSFNVGNGKITGFVGPNGAGKTTTIKMITGLVFPTSGTVLLNGKSVADVKARRGVAYLTEQPYFYAHLTVSEMLDFSARLIQLPSSSVSGEIDRVLELVEMNHKRTAKIRELSKGMQQRINMASALLGSPHTLILDEPMSGMDPPGRRLFRKLMTRLNREGCTLFFSTHVLDDVETLCDDVVVLQQGKLVYSGMVASLLEQGFTGTEIVIGTIGETLQSELKNAGCTFAPATAENGSIVTIPKNGSLSDVQKLLCENGCYPKSIQQRSMTLEELLYQRKPGSAS